MLRRSKFNWDSKESYWIVDGDNYMLLYGGDDPTFAYSEFVRRDAIGRNYDGYVAWKDSRFIEGIKRCWKKVERKGIKRLLFGDYYYEGQRYPDPAGHNVGMSRDHVLNTVYAYAEAGEDVSEFASHIRWNISKFANLTIASWLYLKLISGRSIGKLYYPVTALELLLYKAWNKLIYATTGIGSLGYEEHQDTFRSITGNRPKVIDFITSLVFPNYSLRHKALQLNILPESKWKRLIKKLSWDLIPKYNYAIKILMDHPDGVTEDEISNYKPMTGDRWSDILNKWMNYGRDIKIIEDRNLLIFNALDRDYLISIYENKINKEAV